jgi:sulfite reductase alpha subunit-like flavoprotein
MTDEVVAFISEGDRSLHILFGSQSGNSEDLAVKIGKQASSFGLESTVHDMDGFDLSSLSSMSRVLIVCSTWGEGEQPDNAEDLWNAANGDGAPSLSKTHFSVCALGDTSYELFCESGKEWDKRFEELGGTRLVDRVDCDVDYDKPAAEWAGNALAHMSAVDGSGAFQESMVESIESFVKSGGSVSTSSPAETPVSSEPSTSSGSLEMDGDRSLHILFGSQSGNAEGLAAKIGKRSEVYGLKSTVHDMDGFDLSSLSSMSRVLIVCSTWGEGEQPDNAEELWKAANGDGAPSLSKTHFSVCALGDTSYELFCESGKEWDKRFEELGATRLVDRVDCDVDYDTPSAIWTELVLAHLAAVDGEGNYQPDLVDSIIADISGGEESSVDGDDGFVVPTLQSSEIQVKVRVFRYDPQSSERGHDEWACVLVGNTSVLDVLRTIKATEDGSLTFRDGALNDPTTAIRVNGRPVLPGLTRIESVISTSNTGVNSLNIEPISIGEVVRDLVTDLTLVDFRRASTKPWFRGATREGVKVRGAVVGVMSQSDAKAIHLVRDMISPLVVDSFSDTVPYNENYIAPSNVLSSWSRVIDPRVSDSSRTDNLDLLASDVGIKAETDLSSISRHGNQGKLVARNMLDVKTRILRRGAFQDGRHGKHVWWYTWSVKMSGMVNDTVVYRQVLGPLGLVGNLFTGITARMVLGFTRTGGKMFNGVLGMVAPPAGVGKMPKQFNTPVLNHHEVVAIFNEVDGGF